MLQIQQMLRLFPHLQTAGQRSLVGKTAADGAFHRCPDLLHVIPKTDTFKNFGIFPYADLFFTAVGGDLREGIMGIDLFRRRDGAPFGADHTAADAEHFFIADLFAAAQREQFHRIGMGKLRLRIVKNDLTAKGRKGFFDHRIGAVTFARFRQRTVEDHAERIGKTVKPLFKEFRRLFRSHRMGAGRPAPDLIKFP